LIKKYTHISQLLIVLLLPLATHAQELYVSRTIDWAGAAMANRNDSIIKNIYFEGAYYPQPQSLPLWSETFYSGNPSEDVTTDNCIFQPLTPEELLLIQTYKEQIPSQLSLTSKQVISQKKNGVYIEILPFISDQATGQIRKLVSFRLKFTMHSLLKKSAAGSYAANSVLSQGNWYKLAVTQTGIYHIGYSDLQAMGINPSTVNPAKIGIFGRSGKMLPEANSLYRDDDLPENAIEVTGQADGKFDQGDQILFYAQGPVVWQYNNSKLMWEHTTHLYADTICYFLTTDQGSGKRIPLKEGSVDTETDVVTSYDFYASYEENNINLIKSGRQWFASAFDVITSRSYSFDIPTLAAGGDIRVRSVTAAKSTSSSTFEFTVGSQSWTATHSPISQYPNSPVVSGSNTYKSLQLVSLPFKIEARYNKPSSSAAGYLDLLDINARCDLRFTGGQLDFRDSRSFAAGHVASYRIAGAAGKVRLWEVTNPGNALIIENDIDGNDLVFKLPSDTIRQFIAFDETKLLKPGFIAKIQNQNLHATTGVDMVIIAPQQFIAQAVRLATFHATTSDLEVLVLDPAIIYNEFSSGTIDITAIRDFMRMLYDKASGETIPKYLLLFGDASYDYKNKIPSNTNVIPSWQSPDSYSPISSLVSDDYYGMLDYNEGKSYSDVIDIGIGRLPVKTLEEAEHAVDKIIHYSVPSPETEGDWRNVITFVADDEDMNDHIDQSEQMAVTVEKTNPELNLDKIYLDSYVQVASTNGNRYPDVNKAITQRIEKGSLIFNYTGHGGETGWAHEQVLVINEINNWSNFDNLPVFVTATCEFSRFDDPSFPSAGELVLTNPKGGGIALFTTTRPTYGTPNFELNKKFYQYALSRPDGQIPRMGDIIMNSKRDKGANENGRKYVLLGDPALQMGFAALNVLTTSVKDNVSGLEADTLKAFMEVTIDGMIADAMGNIVTDFNGIVLPSVYDKSVIQKSLANDGGPTFSFRLRKNLLYKGKVKVKDGRFSFTFIVPKDIAYSYDAGKISYYASDGNRDANGFYTDIIVGGSSENGNNDNTGPAISLYMNNTMFHDGGITDQNPKLLAVLYDESGINTIGNGIGHDITAVLDGNTSQPFLLNDFYVSDTNTFKSGYIWFPFSMLSVGEHTLVFKVWDVFNNSSEAEIHFVVGASNEFIITNTYNYPNPFAEYTDIVFEHNQNNVEFKVRAEIYSLTGQLVRILEQTDSQNGSVSAPLRWDGRSQQGSTLPDGIYLYNLFINTSEGFSESTSGKLVYRK